MATTDEIRRYLTTVDFPASKDDIVRAAEEEGATKEVKAALRAMPPVEYANKAEVLSSAQTDTDRSRPANVAAEQARDKKREHIAEHLRDR
jgi:hypothetical protein